MPGTRSAAGKLPAAAGWQPALPKTNPDVRAAKKLLGNSGVKVASVATAFPTGLMPLKLKLQEVRSAARDGADEIERSPIW